MIVTVYGEAFECARAEKGADSVTLYDASGNAIAAFSGISDFTGYEIAGGEWSAGAPDYTAFLSGLMEGYGNE